MTDSEQISIAEEVIQSVRSMTEADQVQNAVFHRDLVETRMENLSGRVAGGTDLRAPMDPHTMSVFKVALDAFENEGVHPLVALSKTVLHEDGPASEAAWGALKGFIM
jgi:hypothetical protein